MAKQKFKVKNWSKYNKSLVNRGSITFWIDKNLPTFWTCNVVVKKRGGQTTYSDKAIMICLTLREVYKLTLRQAQGFVQSILNMNSFNLKAPDYTSLSRRAHDLEVKIPRLPSKGPIDVVVDSTGFKVYGEGEWKVRQHGYSKRRTWTKLHVALNPQTKEILSTVVTSSKIHDSKAFTSMIQKIDRPINRVACDGAYDTKECYVAIGDKKAIPIIPPQRNAKISDDPGLIIRNFCIEYIHKSGNNEDARKKWKTDSGYHMRSIAENAMFRLKTVFSPSLKSRKAENQKTELVVRIAALNKMTISGMPQSYRAT